MQINQPKLVLRFDMPLLGGAHMPRHGIRPATVHAFATLVEQSDTILRLRIAVLGDVAPNPQCF